jgi:hypothetical protein
MARDLKYGQIDIPGIGGDEPVFIMRAQDALSTKVIRGYKVLAVDTKPPRTDDFIRGIEDVQDAFIEFQLQNPEQVKLPD